MANDDAEPSGIAETWDDAPCGLARVDARGVIVEANAALLDRVGYCRADVVGRLRLIDLLAAGSRVFYEAQLAPMLALDGHLQEVMLDLRAVDGRRVPVLLNADRVADADAASGTVGAAGVRYALMSVPDRRAYENDLRLAREQAERARAAETAARLRLELLARANAALVSSIQIDVVLDELARVLVVEMADWCLIFTAGPDESTDLPSWTAVHADPARQCAVERVATLIPTYARADSSYRTVLDGGEPILLAQLSEEYLRSSTASPEVLALYGVLGAASAMVIPSRARGARVATMILVRGTGREPFTAEDLADLTDLGARAGIAIDNARQHAREHNNSIALQQALLTSPPAAPGMEIVTRYLPATVGNAVGGDWYDAFLQADGTLVLVIGDVVGHDIHAAAAMGQLRGVIRTLGYTVGNTPADILRRADVTAHGLGVNTLATAIVARVQDDGDTVTLQWSNAGHPPPLVVTATGAVRRLEFSADAILGFSPHRQRTNHSVRLAAGEVLVLYTDGLVETVDQDIDTGIALLADRLSSSEQLPLEGLCDSILRDHQTGRRDDIALLLLRIRG